MSTWEDMKANGKLIAALEFDLAEARAQIAAKDAVLDYMSRQHEAKAEREEAICGDANMIIAGWKERAKKAEMERDMAINMMNLAMDRAEKAEVK